MADDQLRRWARSADLEPLDWAGLEAKVLAEPVPGALQLESDHMPRPRPWLFLLGALLVAPQVLLTTGASLVGLGLALVHVHTDPTWPEWAEAVARLVFLTAVLSTFVPVLIWTSTRRRSVYGLLTAGGTAAVSAASVLVLSASPPVGAWADYRAFAGGAVVTGLGVVAFLLVVAKPGVHLTWRERLLRPTPQEQWMRGQRALLLEVLAKRGLISSWDITDLMMLPRGAWRELESLPDGRVVRRSR